jgi:hypothetical protein
MFDNELYEKICTISCTFDELNEFNTRINEKEFDTDNAFEKYYRLETILKCIRLFKERKIDAYYLAYWANAYNWIIMSGFNDELEGEKFFIDEIIKYEISDLLDSLSFYDDIKEIRFIDDYEKGFTAYDKVYRTLEDWHIAYAKSTSEVYLEDGYCDYDILAINDKTKEFIYLRIESCEISNETVDGEYFEDLYKIEQMLVKKGYKELDI